MKTSPGEFDSYDFSLLARDVRQEEKTARKEFVLQTRLELARLFGFPDGVPNLGNFPVTQNVSIEGPDRYIGVNISFGKTAYSYPQKIITCDIQEAEFGYDGIIIINQSLVIPAFHGSAYLYKREVEDSDSFSLSRTSSLRRLEDGSILPPRPIIYSGEIKNVGGDFSLLEDVDARRNANEHMLPLLKKLSYANFQ